MEQQPNRLEQEMKEWEAREQRFSTLFSSSILQSRAFKKEKVRHLRNLGSRYRWSSNPDERFTQRLLSQERRQLEKELYPNRLKRNFMRLVGSLGRLATVTFMPAPGKVDRKRVTADLKRAGFKGTEHQSAQRSSQGLDVFSFIDTRKVNEREQLEYRPGLSQGQNGQLNYAGHTVTLTGNAKPVSYQMGPADARLPEKQAYNLLSGRAVLVKGEWLSLDPNDKDADGHLRIKRVVESYGVNLSKELSKLPLKENRLAVTREELAKGLKNGDKVAVSIKVNGKESTYYLASNGKGLDLFNAEGRKTKAGELTAKKQDKNLKQGLSKGVSPQKTGIKPVTKTVRLRP